MNKYLKQFIFIAYLITIIFFVTVQTSANDNYLGSFFNVHKEAKSRDNTSFIKCIKTDTLYHGMKVKVIDTYFGKLNEDTIIIWCSWGNSLRYNYQSNYSLGDTLYALIEPCDTLGNFYYNPVKDKRVEKTSDYMPVNCGEALVNVKRGVVEGYIEELYMQADESDFWEMLKYPSCIVPYFDNYIIEARRAALNEMQFNVDYKNTSDIPKVLLRKYAKAIASVCVHDSIFNKTLFSFKNIENYYIELLAPKGDNTFFNNSPLVIAPIRGEDKVKAYLQFHNCAYHDHTFVNIDGSTRVRIRKSWSNLYPMAKYLNDSFGYDAKVVFEPQKIENGRILFNEEANLIRFEKMEKNTSLIIDSLLCFYEFTFDTTCNAKLLRTHYADYTTEVTKVTEQHIACFPNPVADYLNLQGGNKAGISYEVYALSGTLQSSGQIDNNQVDVSNLPNGVYILKTREENGTLQHHKFVKKGN